MTDSQNAGRADDADPNDVAEAEAEAIAKETSAEQIKPDDRLTAPTTDEASDDAG